MPPEQSITKSEARQIAIETLQEFLNMYQFPIRTVRTPQFHAKTGIPAGGETGIGIKVSSANNFGIFFGSGVPTLSAAQGSLYLRSDGSSTSTRMYVNNDGSTGWSNVTTGS